MQLRNGTKNTPATSQPSSTTTVKKPPANRKPAAKRVKKSTPEKAEKADVATPEPEQEATTVPATGPPPPTSGCAVLKRKRSLSLNLKPAIKTAGATATHDNGVDRERKRARFDPNLPSPSGNLTMQRAKLTKEEKLARQKYFMPRSSAKSRNTPPSIYDIIPPSFTMCPFFKTSTSIFEDAPTSSSTNTSTSIFGNTSTSSMNTSASIFGSTPPSSSTNINTVLYLRYAETHPLPSS